MPGFLQSDGPPWLTPGRFMLESAGAAEGIGRNFLSGVRAGQDAAQFKALKPLRDAQVEGMKAETALREAQVLEQKSWFEDAQQLPTWLREVGMAKSPEDLDAVTIPPFKSARGWQVGNNVIEQKRQQLESSAAGKRMQGIAEAERQVAFREAEDLLALKKGGYLSGDPTPENLYHARFDRSREQAATLARQYGAEGELPPLESHTVTRGPDGMVRIEGDSAFIRRDGTLNVEAWTAALQPLARRVAVPEGMEAERITIGPPANRVTLKKKEGKSREEWVRETAADLAKTGLTPDLARQQAEQLYDGKAVTPVMPTGPQPPRRVWQNNQLVPK